MLHQGEQQHLRRTSMHNYDGDVAIVAVRCLCYILPQWRDVVGWSGSVQNTETLLHTLRSRKVHLASVKDAPGIAECSDIQTAHTGCLLSSFLAVSRPQSQRAESFPSL